MFSLLVPVDTIGGFYTVRACLCVEALKRERCETKILEGWEKKKGYVRLVVFVSKITPVMMAVLQTGAGAYGGK